MAVINAYTDPKISGNAVQKVLRALNAHGAMQHIIFATVTVGATDSNGSIYRIFKNMDPDATICQMYVANTVITAGTSYGLGLYQPNLSTNLATATANYFSGAMDMSAAAASINPKTAKDGLAGLSPTLNVYNNRLFEHAGATITNRPSAYDMGLTAATIGTSGGTICVQAVLAID